MNFYEAELSLCFDVNPAHSWTIQKAQSKSNEIAAPWNFKMLLVHYVHSSITQVPNIGVWLVPLVARDSQAGELSSSPTLRS